MQLESKSLKINTNNKNGKSKYGSLFVVTHNRQGLTSSLFKIQQLCAKNQIILLQ